MDRLGSGAEAMNDSLFDQDSSGPVARAASVVVAIAYIVAAYVSSSWVDAVEVATGLLLPVACIWFPDALGTCVGFVGTQFVSEDSSGPGVFIMGWVVLLLPIPMGVIIHLMS